MVKKKQKKVVKQKQKQNVNVKQNVKVVVGDVKRKQVRKATGEKASAKPPMVLNISNPQPLNNAYFEYFKKQLQNQEPIKASSLSQQEKINEREETKASKAGALHRLDQEQGADVQRELNRQGEALQARLRQGEYERKLQEEEMVKSYRKTPKETKSSLKLTQPQQTPSSYRIVTSKKEEEDKPISVATSQPTSVATPQTQEQNPFSQLEEEQTRSEFPSSSIQEEALKRRIEEQKAYLEREMMKSKEGGAGAIVESRTQTTSPAPSQPKKVRGKSKTAEQLAEEAEIARRKAEERAYRDEKKRQADAEKEANRQKRAEAKALREAKKLEKQRRRGR